MDWASVWMDIVGGLLIAGALAAWVPAGFWQSFFIADHPVVAKLWGPIIGPLVAVVSFVCSVGNMPLAAVLWNGGISFGGVIAFIFADLIILPILNIYRKYYGLKMAGFLFATFYAAMAGAALVVELIFGALGLVTAQRNARVVEASDYHRVNNLDISFGVGNVRWTANLAALRCCLVKMIHVSPSRTQRADFLHWAPQMTFAKTSVSYRWMQCTS
jgi:Predicted permease